MGTACEQFLGKSFEEIQITEVLEEINFSGAKKSVRLVFFAHCLYRTSINTYFTFNNVVFQSETKENKNHDLQKIYSLYQGLKNTSIPACPQVLLALCKS